MVKMTDVRSSEASSVAKEMGVLGILFFMIKSYWKILDKLLTGPRFRKAQKMDDRLPRSARTTGVTG